MLVHLVIAYVVVGLILAAVASIVADRTRIGVGATALLTALLWPILLIGAAQLAAWTGTAKLLRKAGA